MNSTEGYLSTYITTCVGKRGGNTLRVQELRPRTLNKDSSRSKGSTYGRYHSYFREKRRATGVITNRIEKHWAVCSRPANLHRSGRRRCVPRYAELFHTAEEVDVVRQSRTIAALDLRQEGSWSNLGDQRSRRRPRMRKR